MRVLNTSLSSSTDLKKNNNKVYILCSYYFLHQETTLLRYLREQPKDTYELMVDSGAFSSMSTGAPINLDEYCRFLSSIDDLQPFYSVQLDVIGDPKKTLENYKIMQSRGVPNLLPVFTRGSPYEWLDDLYQESDYVLAGGLVIPDVTVKYKFAEAIVKKAAGRRLHLLGFDSSKHLKKLRPYSADSSGITTPAARYGVCSVYMGGGKTTILRRQDLKTEKRYQLKRFAAIMKYDYERLFYVLNFESSWRRNSTIKGLEDAISKRSAVSINLSAVSYLLRARDYLKRLNIRIYGVVGSNTDFKVIMKNAEHIANGSPT